jgi:hypothetical protein
MARADAQYPTLQVICNRKDAKRIRTYCKRKKVAVSTFLKRLALFTIAADPK